MTWRIERVEQEPTKTLDAWTPGRLDAWTPGWSWRCPFDGADRPWTRHFVGFRREGCKGQVSSPVEGFDPVRRRAVTRTGQVYELGALPGVNGDAFATWGRWKHLNRIAHERDVTDEVAEDLGHVY